MLLNVSELLLVLANSTVDMYPKEVQEAMSLEEAVRTVKFLADLHIIVDKLEEMPMIIVEIVGDESFIYNG